MPKNWGFHFTGDACAFDGFRHGIQGRKRDICHPYQVIPVFIYAEVDQLFRYFHAVPPYSNSVEK